MGYNATVMGENENQSLEGYIGVIGAVPAGSNYIVIQGGTLDEQELTRLGQWLANLERDVTQLISDVGRLRTDVDGAYVRINDIEQGDVPIQIDYNDLDNKPSINGETLSGNKTSADLHIASGGGGSIPSLISLYQNTSDTVAPSGTTITLTQNYITYNQLQLQFLDLSAAANNTIPGDLVVYTVDENDRHDPFVATTINVTSSTGKEVTIEFTSPNSFTITYDEGNALLLKSVAAVVVSAS